MKNTKRTILYAQKCVAVVKGKKSRKMKWKLTNEMSSSRIANFAKKIVLFFSDNNNLLRVYCELQMLIELAVDVSIVFTYRSIMEIFRSFRFQLHASFVFIVDSKDSRLSWNIKRRGPHLEFSLKLTFRSCVGRSRRKKERESGI